MRRHITALLIRLNGWPRRIVALCCLLGALVSALHPHRTPASRAATAVVVAARNLPIGTVLDSADVRLARWPATYVPRRALVTTRAALGRRLSTPLAGGEPVTLSRIVGTGLTAGLAADMVASTVETATDLSALVHAGDRVDLLVAPADDPASVPSAAPASVVARDAQVLAVFAQAQPDAGNSSTLVVATSRSSALLLAAVSGSRILAVLGPSP